MLNNIGVPGILLIFLLALIIFGPQKLPQLGRAVGQTFREFRKTVQEVTRDGSEQIDDSKSDHVAQPLKTKQEANHASANRNEVE